MVYSSFYDVEHLSSKQSHNEFYYILFSVIIRFHPVMVILHYTRRLRIACQALQYCIRNICVVYRNIYGLKYVFGLKYICGLNYIYLWTKKYICGLKLYLWTKKYICELQINSWTKNIFVDLKYFCGLI